MRVLTRTERYPNFYSTISVNHMLIACVNIRDTHYGKSLANTANSQYCRTESFLITANTVYTTEGGPAHDVFLISP
jgi:hypothetical protein